MLPEEEYGYTFHIRQVQPRREAQQLLKVNCYTECTQPLNDLLVCVSLNLNGQAQWFDAVDLGADPAGP
ncbi:hypothetical protein, partial [Salmonella enterica]|uniref:hypothetical protein n=1 Tax=Salmonella enterica TaxID=28901 RepID=UPI0020A28DD3